ncbi:alpha/beta fold hydrolase [Marixanthomonas spongiae]|uniref:Alpha/beta hydrolase n=1 Tax=Marixanthomonas spongiae TaxID=2174845 RepID=A0A2U0HZG2_9FLAO|nr:alpha/beta hydrolase [Marixanthomonas spongiae]PVW14130.1 alpha/beta hydrolase [Marixanthomonas spongiae]
MTHTYKNTPIHYNVTGTGPTMVLLHGFLERSTMWDRYVPSLSEKFTVITIDFPGHGKSGVISGTHTMELMAKVVKSVLNEAGIASATLVGHSMGGYVALAYTELFEAEVEKLILLNSTPLADSEARKQNRKRALKVMDYNAEAFISMAITNLFPEKSRQHFVSDIEALKNAALQFPVAGIQAAIRGMIDRKDRTDILAHFSKKKTMVCGKEDPLMPIAESKAISEKTNTRFIELEGGHMSWLENSYEIYNILHFIE